MMEICNIATLMLQVVLMNQMTTRVTEVESKTVPALGESWSHLSNHKIELYNKNGTLYAHLFKSSNRKCDTVPFCITVSLLKGLVRVGHS